MMDEWDIIKHKAWKGLSDDERILLEMIERLQDDNPNVSSMLLASMLCLRSSALAILLSYAIEPIIAMYKDAMQDEISKKIRRN
jgi:hypothetical protein